MSPNSATAPTSASHHNPGEGTLGHESRESKSVAEFVVVNTVIRRGPFFTIRSALETLGKSDDSEKDTCSKV
jgi:hypothetical protein